MLVMGRPRACSKCSPSALVLPLFPGFEGCFIAINSGSPRKHFSGRKKNQVIDWEHQIHTRALMRGGLAAFADAVEGGLVTARQVCIQPLPLPKEALDF